MQHPGILPLLPDAAAHLAKCTGSLKQKQESIYCFSTGCHSLTCLLWMARWLLILGRGTQGPLHDLTTERNKGTCETESRPGFLSCLKTKGVEEVLTSRLQPSGALLVKPSFWGTCPWAPELLDWGQLAAAYPSQGQEAPLLCFLLLQAQQWRWRVRHYSLPLCQTPNCFPELDEEAKQKTHSFS